MSPSKVEVFLLFLLPFLTFGHICLIWPPQRGGWNPGSDTAGDSLCFEPNAPCGTKPVPKTPTDELLTGTTVYVSFQQNLNHYNPGWPGFIDIAFASGPNHTTDNGFITLAQIPDFWSHSQSSRTNFSVPIQIPTSPCDWCTLRIRYHPNKPTEPIFHNCADVKFVSSSTNFPKKIYGFMSPTKQITETTLMEIQNTGQLTPIDLTINVLKRGVISDQFLAEGLVAPHFDSNSVFFVGDNLEIFEEGMFSPSSLYRYDLVTTGLSVTKLKSTQGQWNALITSKNNLIGVQQMMKEKDMFFYTVSQISFTGDVSLFGQTVPESTFVNFFWADLDQKSGTVYILAGDEDSLFTLDAVLHSITPSGVTTVVPLNSSNFTLSHIHVDPMTGIIYSISPGIYGKNDWSVVVIDPKTGAVSLKAKIDISSEWTSAPGGGVYNGFYSGQIIHSFQSILTGSTILALIDVSTGSVVYHTDINMGVNLEKKVFNLFAL